MDSILVKTERSIYPHGYLQHSSFGEGIAPLFCVRSRFDLPLALELSGLFSSVARF